MKNKTVRIAIRYIKNIIGICATIAIFVGIIQTLNYLYQSTDDVKYRILWEDYYQNCGKIENLYLGSSHVYCGINAPMMTDLTGEYCFDMATQSQRLKGTFYLLREADHGNHLKHVYVDMYYLLNTVDEDGVDPADVGYSYNWQNTDYMKWSANKMAYMLSIGGSDKCIDVLFPFCRYREKLGDWDYIKQTIVDKKVDGDKVDRFGYQGQGFWAYTINWEDRDKCRRQDRILDEQPMGEKSKKYLYQIIQYCQEREIPVTLFVSPISDLQLISTVNYDNYINEVRAIATEYKIPFYDFNLAREQYFPIRQDNYFRDIGHLNMSGAELFTSFFYQVISQEESGNTNFFYASYEERLLESTPAVYGIYYGKPVDRAEMTEPYRNIWIASNRDFGMEYRIILNPDEGDEYTIQDFERNKEFTVPFDEHGICTITWRTEEMPHEEQTMEINY